VGERWWQVLKKEKKYKYLDNFSDRKLTMKIRILHTADNQNKFLTMSTEFDKNSSK
jgi:hypothetical protein